MYALTHFGFIQGIIAPKWCARAIFLPQNGLHAEPFLPVFLFQAIAPLQVGRSVHILDGNSMHCDGLLFLLYFRYDRCELP
mgnify:FL=1